MAGLFASRNHIDFFGIKKSTSKPTNLPTSGMFNGLSVKKASPQSKETIPNSAYSPRSFPESQPNSVQNEEVYIPPVMPVSLPHISDFSVSSEPVSSATQPSVKSEDFRSPEIVLGNERLKSKSKATLGLTEKGQGLEENSAPQKQGENVDFRLEESVPSSFSELKKRREEQLRVPQTDQQQSTRVPIKEPILTKNASQRREEEAKRAENESLEKAKRVAEEKERECLSDPELLDKWTKERLTGYSTQLREKNKTQTELLSDSARLQQKLDEIKAYRLQSFEKQDKAAFEEDYEEAERLTSIISDLDASIVKTDQDIARNAGLYESYEHDKAEIYHAQNVFLTDTLTKCSEMKAFQESEFASFSAKRKLEEADKITLIETEVSRLEKESERVQQETRNLVAEQEQIQASIEQHTKELQDGKTASELELQDLDTQIQDLEAKLASLNTEKRACLQVIEVSEAQIRERLTMFQDEIYSVETKEKRLNQAKQRLQSDSDHLTQAKTGLESFLTETKTLTSAHEAKCSAFSTCLATLKQRQERLDRLESSRKRFIETIERNEGLLKGKQEELRTGEEYANTVKETIKEVRLKLKQRKDQLEELENKIPRLEAEKKAFACAKQYKDAGRLATEVKSAISDREGLLEEIERGQATLTIQEQEISEVSCN